MCHGEQDEPVSPVVAVPWLVGVPRLALSLIDLINGARCEAVAVESCNEPSDANVGLVMRPNHSAEFLREAYS